MPPYPWLLEETLDFSTIPKRIKVMKKLGVPYDQELNQAEEMAREQAKQIARETVEQGGPEGLADKKVIALIAYLQRLGTDLYKTVPGPENDNVAYKND